MFFSALAWVISILLFFGAPSDNRISNEKAPSFFSTPLGAFGVVVVDAFQFQFQSTARKCNRSASYPTTSFSLLRQASEKSSASESSAAISEQKSATTLNAPPAKDREEDLKFTIEIIMRFIESSNSNSDDSSMNDIKSNQDSSNELAKDQEKNARSLPVDHKMNSKYEELALLVKEEVEKQQLELKSDDSSDYNAAQATTTWWCAIAGGPGSGKSTLAKRVSEICSERFGIPSIVVPMDGYLFSRSDLSQKLELDERGRLDYLRRRGSPHTVDAKQLCQDLMAASGRQPTLQNGFYNIFVGDGSTENPIDPSVPSKPCSFAFPDYRRTAPSDPVSEQIQFDPSLHKVVFLEGEYLLLGKGGMVPGYVTETESKRWKPLLDVFDATWFVSCQQQDGTTQDENAAAEAQGWYDYDFQEQRKRRMQHHLEQDEDDEETLQALFPSFSKGQALSREDVASKRLESNDVLNMLIAETSKQHASLIIRSV